MNLKKTSILFCLLILSTVGDQIFAQDSIPKVNSKLDFLREIDQRDWRIKVPIWVPGFRGSFAYGGITSYPGGGDFTVIDRLNGELGIEFYLIGNIQYTPKKWLFEVDGFHATLASNLQFENIDKVQFLADIEGTILRGIMGYRVFEKRNEDRYFNLEIYPYAGFRYIDLRVFSQNSDVLDIDPTWAEPIIGLQIPLQYRRWFFSTQVDVGGFSINNHWSWNANIDATYRFSKLFALGAGWTFLNFNYDQDFQFKYLDLEIQLAGPVLGVEFHL